MPASLCEIFGPDGPLAEALDGYTVREQQVAMAEHVAAALAGHDQLIIEAGTGTGKTFAYLGPALLSGRRVIVSTGTKALQDQLFHRDLPAICSALGRPVRVALLKGRANYLCKHRLDVAEQQAYARGLRREVAVALPKVKAWSYTTKRGDIAELPGFGEQDAVWPWVTSTRENCLGTECAKFDECFVLAARREAQAADIVVVNHYLLMADLVLKEEGFGDLLPGVDAIVIDEAHQLPDVAAQFLGYSVSTRQLAGLAKDLTGELLLSQQMGGRVDAAVGALDQQVAAVITAAAGVEARLEHSQWPDRLLEALNGLAGRASELADALGPLASTDGQAAFARLRERLEESAQRLAALTGEELPGGVRWAETSPRSVSCHFAPVDVATQLAALLQAQPCAWVLTSATLAVEGSFSYVRSRLGIERCDEIQLASEFDFASQALLYLPKRMPSPKTADFAPAAGREVLDILRRTKGRAFVLFTSYAVLRTVQAALDGALEYPMLVQGSAPRSTLLAQFRSTPHAVLLATSSFWQGVDVVGEALSCVIVDRLPFASPGDPVVAARVEAIAARGGDGFADRQVPRAILTRLQGLGRLIRHRRDRGVLAILDPRIRTMPYGRRFLASLPPAPVSADPADIDRFFAAGSPSR